MKKWNFWMLILLIGLAACQQKSPFEQMKERELASGIRQDSLFFGLYLGMPSKEYFDHCLEMNHRKLFTHGTTNTGVEYVFNNGEMNYPVKMSFYPVFVDGKIEEMIAEFEYKTWAPWMKDRFSDVLQEQVLRLFEKWYGPGFLKMKHPMWEYGYVKIDGNRLIVIERKDDRVVKVTYRDLFAEKQADKKNFGVETPQ